MAESEEWSLSGCPPLQTRRLGPLPSTPRPQERPATPLEEHKRLFTRQV